MNTNSNSYTIIYASVMVVIVAFLLAFVSSSLRETQNKNVELDTKKQILAALNIKDVKDAEAEYNKYVKGDMLMNVDGTLTENTGAFATAYEKEAKENNRLHVFVAEVDTANGSNARAMWLPGLTKSRSACSSRMRNPAMIYSLSIVIECDDAVAVLQRAFSMGDDHDG